MVSMQDDAPHLPSSSTEAAAVDEGRRAFSQWLWRLPVVAAMGGAAYGAWLAYRVHFSKDAPNPRPTFDAVTSTPIAPLDAFDEAWAHVNFMLQGRPCVAVRVPQAIPGGISTRTPSGEVHLVAFVRICTHLSCIVELNRDVEAVAFAFNHRSSQPSLTCACHYSVFDPLRAGRAVSGPAVRPLPRARLRVDEQATPPLLTADGIELT